MSIELASQDQKYLKFEEYKKAVFEKQGLELDEKNTLIKMVEESFANTDIETIQQGISFVKESDIPKIKEQIHSYNILMGLSDGMLEINLGLQKLKILVNDALKEGAEASHLQEQKLADSLLNQI